MSVVPESPVAQACALTDGQLGSAWHHICDCKAGGTGSGRCIHLPKDTQLLESSSALTFPLPLHPSLQAHHTLRLCGAVGGLDGLLLEH